MRQNALVLKRLSPLGKAKINAFLEMSKRTMNNQIAHDALGKYLADGGLLPAMKMLQEAAKASYLPPKLRHASIIKWANQVKLHRMALARTSAEADWIEKDTEQLIQGFLQKAGLKSKS